MYWTGWTYLCSSMAPVGSALDQMLETHWILHPSDFWAESWNGSNWISAHLDVCDCVQRSALLVSTPCMRWCDMHKCVNAHICSMSVPPPEIGRAICINMCRSLRCRWEVPRSCLGDPSTLGKLGRAAKSWFKLGLATKEQRCRFGKQGRSHCETVQRKCLHWPALWHGTKWNVLSMEDHWKLSSQSFIIQFSAFASGT